MILRQNTILFLSSAKDLNGIKSGKIIYCLTDPYKSFPSITLESGYRTLKINFMIRNNQVDRNDESELYKIINECFTSCNYFVLLIIHE